MHLRLHLNQSISRPKPTFHVRDENFDKPILLFGRDGTQMSLGYGGIFLCANSKCIKPQRDG